MLFGTSDKPSTPLEVEQQREREEREQLRELRADQRPTFFAQLSSLFSDVKRFIDESWVKLNHLTETNYDLGFRMAHEGRIEDAIFRFRVTLWLSPEHEGALYNLGCLYQHKGQIDKALALFKRVIARNPNHANAIYRVATINPALLKAEMQPQTVPPIQLVEYFDQYAPNYDADMAQQVYRLPDLLHQLLRPMLGNITRQQNMLDIGCGTGLIGEQFREDFANLVGVDLSNFMLDVAYRRVDNRGVKLYNHLVHMDVRHYLADPETPAFDVAVAMSVLPYIGELSLLASQLGRIIRPGGYIALSFDLYHQPEGFGVMPETGFFGHSLSYVMQVMKDAGFVSRRTGEVEARVGKQVQLCFFQKPQAADNETSSHAAPGQPY